MTTLLVLAALLVGFTAGWLTRSLKIERPALTLAHRRESALEALARATRKD